jgi:drug/metabolite transporter (DMT)-like permease
LITVVIWSFHFVSVKYAISHGFSPLVFATLRFAVGILLFVAITYRREGTIRIERRDAPILLGILGLTTLVNQVAFPIGADLTSASTMALLFGTMPILVGTIGWRLGYERPHARHWLAAGITCGGVVLVAVGAQGGISSDLAGIVIGLVAVGTWAYYTAAVGPLMRRYSPYRISAAVGLAALLPLAVVSAPELANEDWSAIPPLAWSALVYSTLIAFVLTYVLWFTAIGRVGANRSSIYANLQPFLGAVFAVAVLSETLTLVQVVGGAIIGIGVIVARSRRAPVEVVG